MLGSRWLVVAPHPDDSELGMGGTMAAYADRVDEIKVLMLSDRGEPTWMSEACTAAGKISDKITVETLHLTVFHMDTERQTLLRSLEQYRDTFAPTCVFVPTVGDLHQDHETALREARRVFKSVSLLGYEIPVSSRQFTPQLFVPVTVEDVARKHEAVQCYSTQRDKPYCQADAITGLAKVRGVQCGRKYAEAFSVEWLVAG